MASDAAHGHVTRAQIHGDAPKHGSLSVAGATPTAAEGSDGAQPHAWKRWESMSRHPVKPTAGSGLERPSSQELDAHLPIDRRVSRECSLHTAHWLWLV